MKDTNQLLVGIKSLMTTDNYPVAGPVAPDVMADLMNNAPPVEWDDSKKSAYKDVRRLLVDRADYACMFDVMDGFEYNGLTLYSLAVADGNGVQLWSNIYICNIDVRENDIYVDANLSDKVVIGEDGMSYFVYSFEDSCFQIRDRVASDYVIESHAHFSDLLAALVESVS
ncbi:TPA: hypothetical protein QCG56_002833 [Enterobacter cancerogenus]|nr:hypothetical protein [Enterobacter cancerogenus]HDR2165892.1 hypothetical protein [Enterobacter cancerogenus]HDR2268550.1 hypothetical protein [Enterobacter cancerogenus]